MGSFFGQWSVAERNAGGTVAETREQLAKRHVVADGAALCMRLRLPCVQCLAACMHMRTAMCASGVPATLLL